MEKKINYAMVGLFVIVLAATWLAISLWLALGDFSTNYIIYQVNMDESVSGLYLEAPVKYRGVEVGKVTSIKLNPELPSQVQLLLGIEAEVPIKKDTVAVLTVQGMTGIAFVDLTGGSLSSPPLAALEHEFYPVIKTRPSFFARLDTSGTQLVANLNQLASALATVLDDDGTRALGEILDNINSITGALARRQDELEQGIVSAAKMLENGAVVSGQLSPVLSQLDATAKAFADMAATLSNTGENLNRYMASSGAGVEQFSQQTLPELGALISELRRLADTLQSIGQKLEDDPRVLLYGPDLEMPGPGE